MLRSILQSPWRLKKKKYSSSLGILNSTVPFPTVIFIILFTKNIRIVDCSLKGFEIPVYAPNTLLSFLYENTLFLFKVRQAMKLLHLGEFTTLFPIAPKQTLVNPFVLPFIFMWRIFIFIFLFWKYFTASTGITHKDSGEYIDV